MGSPRAVVLAIGLLLVAAAHAQPLERHTVASDGHLLAVWSKLPASPRRVMLLVHGRTWSTRPDFDLQVPGEDKSLMDGLAAMDIASYGVDLRGYGATPRDAGGFLTPDRAVADVAAVLAWIARRHPELGAPALFGWSYGAMVAQLLAQRHPERLSALMLFGYPVRPGIDRTPEGLDGDPPRRPTTAAAAAEDVIVPGSISDLAVSTFVTTALAADPVRMDWRALEQWQALDAAAVRVPTLLMEGEHDPLTQDDVHAALFANLGTADKLWVVLPGGDHAAHLETPRAYLLSLIRTFLLDR